MNSHEPPPNRSTLESRVVRLTLACVLAGSLFAAGRLTAPQAAPPKPTVHCGTMGDSERVIEVHRYLTQPEEAGQAATPVTRSVEASTVRNAPDPVAVAVSILAQTVDSLSSPPSIPGSRQNDLEASARPVRQFVRGLSAGLRASDPMVIHALASEITNDLCGNALTQDKSLVLAYLLQDIPEVATSEGLDCFFRQHNESRNLPVREMLSAWRRSGLEASPAVAEVARATDEARRKQVAATEAAQSEPVNLASAHAAMSSAERKSFVGAGSKREP